LLEELLELLREEKCSPHQTLYSVQTLPEMSVRMREVVI
jgi:hypothetical protein